MIHYLLVLTKKDGRRIVLKEFLADPTDNVEFINVSELRSNAPVSDEPLPEPGDTDADPV